MAGTNSQWQENIDTLATNSGAMSDAAVTDYTLSASEISLLKGIIKQLATGGTSGTQYVDGASAPAHPIGNELVFNNAGTMTAVSAANPFPTSATVTPAANQRVNAQSGDFVAGAIADLATYLTLAGAPGDANTVNSLMGRLTKIRDLLNAGIAVTGTFWQTTQPVSAASLPLPSGAAKESGGNLDTLVASLGAIGDAAWGLSGNGDSIAILKKIALLLNAALAVTQSGTWTVQPGNTPNITPWLFSPQVASSGGSIPYHNLTANSANFTNVKGSACQMYSARISNTSSSVVFFKVYNLATTPGTGSTSVDTVQVPANSTIIGAFPEGMKFGTGFGWALTGAVADNDNTAVAANCVVDFSLNS